MCSKEQKYRIQRTKRTNRRNMIDFAVLPTFSTSYTHGGALTNTTIMPAVGSVANPAQFEIITQKQLHV